MPQTPKKKLQKKRRSTKIKMIPQMKPTGGVRLSKDRMPLVASQWKKFASSLRQMDKVHLGDTEPATLVVWKGENTWTQETYAGKRLRNRLA